MQKVKEFRGRSRSQAGGLHCDGELGLKATESFWYRQGFPGEVGVRGWEWQITCRVLPEEQEG